MTDTYPEPLVKVVRRTGIDGKDLYVVSCNGAPVDLVSGDPVSAHIDAEIINDAHEARVKEAVREAVEEFRERAARVCDDSVMWVPRGNVSECTKTPHELAADIRALSVDGEGG